MNPETETVPTVEPSAILVEFSVNCGDHGETRRSAIHVTRDTTIGELVDQHLTRTFPDYRYGRNGRQLRVEANQSSTIELRGIYEPKEEK